jgi:hypothetical protein
MTNRFGRAVSVLLLAVGSIAAVTAPASAAVSQVDGDAFYDVAGDDCPLIPPAPYEDFVSYPPLAMDGDLVGCLYTKVISTKDLGAPSGIYQEIGEEVFVGSLDDGPSGTFATTYRFESKWAPDFSTGVEVHGRCQHPIVAGSGTLGFAGVLGRLDFKDDVVNAVYYYRGHLRR